jgi:hypothetical protein
VTNRHSIITTNQIEYSFWLIFDSSGGVRLSRAQPDIKRDERAMACIAKLPRSLFKTPELKATITIGDPSTTGFTIDAQAASDALKAAIGVDIDLRIMEQPA